MKKNFNGQYQSEKSNNSESQFTDEEIISLGYQAIATNGYWALANSIVDEPNQDAQPKSEQTQVPSKAHKEFMLTNCISHRFN